MAFGLHRPSHSSEKLCEGRQLRSDTSVAVLYGIY